jgi:hypothetical protein
VQNIDISGGLNRSYTIEIRLCELNEKIESGRSLIIERWGRAGLRSD